MELETDDSMGQDGDGEQDEPNDPSAPDWTQLPQLVLSKICGFLEDTDRCGMAVTCRAWSHVLDTPQLWRHRMLEISGNQGRRSCLLVKRYGWHIRDLTITCIPCSRLAELTTVGYLEEVLGCLLHVPLLELATVFSPMDLTSSSLHLLICFLQHQRQLRNLQMYLAECSVEVGCGLLEAVAESSGDSLSHLALDEFFEVQVPLYQVARFHRLLGRFQGLSHLVLNYSCLGDGTLLTLAHTLGDKWHYLEIRVRKCDLHVHSLSAHSWRRARALCPGLRVSLYLCHTAPDSAMRVLSPGIPLTMVNLALCPPNPRPPDPRQVATPRSVLAHLASCLHLMLEEVQLSALMMDMAEAVLLLVSRCSELKCLHLSSSHSPLLLHLACALCLERQQGKTRLEQLFVYAKGTSGEEARAMRVMQEGYRSCFSRLCLYYSLTNPTPPRRHRPHSPPGGPPGSPPDRPDEGGQERLEQN